MFLLIWAEDVMGGIYERVEQQLLAGAVGKDLSPMNLYSLRMRAQHTAALAQQAIFVT